jgi:DNA-binding GntR family transcriptional regulator
MPIPETEPHRRRTLARDTAYTDLRDWILEGTLAPGERLHDLELAERLGVSRTPVREALQRLEDEGLVETSPNRWTRVAPLDVSIATDLYPIIWQLEKLALEFAAFELDDAELDQMERANQRLVAALDANDAVGAAQADSEFHQVYIDLCGNAELITILQALKVKLRRLELHYFSSHSARESVAEHTALLTALELGDIAAATTAIETNWRNSQRRMLAEAG